MCLRRRFKRCEDIYVAPGAKELVLDLEERCCIKQVALYVNMDDSTGTAYSKWIIKIDEDEVLNEAINNLFAYYCGYVATENSSRPLQFVEKNDTAKVYTIILLDLGRVERRFAVFFKNEDTSNTASVRVGVIYDILEDEK